MRTFDFEVILHENGAIRTQVRQAPPSAGGSSTTGLEDDGETRGVTYACDAFDSLRDRLAVAFVPPGTAWSYPVQSAELTFAAALSSVLPDQTPVTNTATLADGYGGLYRLAAAIQARAPLLAESFKQAAPAVVVPGEPITYTVYVRNSGGSRVQGQMADALPPELAYQPGSLLCGSGACGFASGVITWTGVVEARSMVPVRFRAVASPALIEGALFTNTAVITDVANGARYRASARVHVSGPGGQTRSYLPIILREP